MSARSRLLVVALLVFALAVGVLLGSGPLRSALGSGGSGAELERARADADAAAAQATLGRDFADAAGPAAVRGTLAGHVVALVRTADATDDDLAAASARLAAAGAEVGATVALADEWTAEDRGPFRDALAEQMASALADPPGGATTSQVLSAALAQALAPGVSAGDDLVGADAAARADTLWSLLTDAGLVTGQRDQSADLFLLVSRSGDVDDLANAFKATSNGTVAAITGADAHAISGVSTVTHAATFYGGWAVVGALVSASGGITGAYDAGDAATLIGGASGLG